MLVSTKGRYALRVMVELAQHQDTEYVQLDVIAKRQNISEKYLESIVNILSKGELVEGLRGRGGGYRLRRKASDYKVGEILNLVEGSLSPVACLECKPNKCDRACECKTLPLWEKLDTVIHNFLDSVTLADLIDSSQTGDYQI